jgi:D-glycero-beta-D-manno-heptose 1-phosphate adenylyltransferase
MIKSKIPSTLSHALLTIDTWREKGENIVFTNGCFDILHMGHVLYLEEAKSLGSKLILAINSDVSVSSLKGPNRPIVDQIGRSYVVAALESVDMVLIFEEETPLQLIEAIIPDVLVKGGDWSIDQIVGSDVVIAHGGIVKSLQFVDGYSTTSIESKIKSS